MSERTLQEQKNLRKLNQASKDGIGGSPLRPDGTLKVKGEFAYSSDLWHEDMLWGMALRSPHPRANILSVDVSQAVKLPGVYAVLTHEDIPGAKFYGLEIADQPALAIDKVRYHGEAIAIVAADHPETARRAVRKIEVEYEVLPRSSPRSSACTRRSTVTSMSRTSTSRTATATSATSRSWSTVWA